MSKYTYVTKERRVKETSGRIKRVKNTRTRDISNQIAEARDKGDLSENAEYDAAKDAQGMLEMKIAGLESKVASARILDETNIDTSKVSILSTVKIKNKKNGAEMTYSIVPEEEADLKTGKISMKSPIAAGLLGKVQGDTVKVTVPAGELEFEVIEITR